VIAAPSTEVSSTIEPGVTRWLGMGLALVLAVGASAGLAWAYGSAPLSIRNAWPVALLLATALSLPTAVLVAATWWARSLRWDWRLGALIAVAGVLMRIGFFGAGAMLEDDHLRYRLDGAMLAHGMSPYHHSPADLLAGAGGILAVFPAFATDLVAAINFPDLRTIYPGAAQSLFAAAHLIDPWGVDGLRAVIFVAEALTALLLVLILREQNQPLVLVALYWCNPLIAFSLTGQAHIDAAMMPAVLGAVLAASRSRGLLAGLALGFAVGVKLWPVLLAPLLARAIWPDRAACFRFVASFILASGVFCVPLVLSTRSGGSGLVAYASNWSVNNMPYAWASFGASLLFADGLGERILRAVIAAGSIALALALAVSPTAGLPSLVQRAAAIATFVFFASPAQFPWYAVWILPFAVILPSAVLASVTALIPAYFLFFPLAAAGLRDVHGHGIAAIHFVPCLILIGLVARHRFGRGVDEPG